jgi:TolB-like protein
VSNYFDELKRRNVFRVGAAYAVVGWLTIEVVDTLAPRMAMPEWVPGFFIMLVIIGLPIALLFSWAFEMTPEGLKKTAEVEVDESITSTTGQKINYVIIAALAAVVLFQQFAPSLSTIRTLAGGGDEPQSISIAVLPFADLSAAGDQEYLGDGVAEEILNVLAGIEGLKVTSRTSAFAFKGQNLQIPEIAKALKVSHVVEGSVRKQNDQVRITAQLIEVADDSHLWSDTFDSDLSNIFKLQDEIAGNISSALSTRLNLALPGIERETPDWDIAAYELYLRARQVIIARGDFSEAIGLLDTALSIEPEFADAWAEKGAALALLAWDLGVSDERASESRATYNEAWLAARRATDIDPGHSLGTAVQGLVRVNQHRFIEARVLFERSVTQENPADNAFLWLAITHDLTGDFDGGLAILEARLAESPTAPNLLRWRDQILSQQGRWQEIWEYRSAAAAVEMEQTITNQQLAGVIIGETKVEEFIAWGMKKFPNMSSENVAFVDIIAGILVRGSDEPLEPSMIDRILDSDAEFVGSLASLLPTEYEIGYLQRITVGLAEKPNANVLGYLWADTMSELRQRPEALQLFRDLELPAYWDLYGWPPMCRRIDISEFECD